ncbi:synaptotagmin-14-like [Actinia tenebrosa]|uniref:Synaptotagmin-14-like n=1 Tax=Actinia tenebrosa TaxID=6105 RepID=A0A6P8H252_ACTTE|nr:synaptotagmin-14-like [Actinia tenebrosa]
MSNPMFSFWRCCVTGDTDTTKLKKKKKQANGPVENNHNEGPADLKAENLELEYHTNGVDVDQPPSSTPMAGEKKVYDEEESGYNQDEVDSSIAPSEVECMSLPPSTVQIVKDGGNDASTPRGDIGSGGRIYLNAKYDKKSNKVNIKINKIEFGAYQEWKMQDLEVSCMLLPMHQQSFRRRSKRFSEPLAIQLPTKTKMSGSSLRFRIYDHKAITRKYLIGQGLVSLEDLKLTDGVDVNILLDLNSPDTYGIDTRYISGIDSVGQAVPDTARPEMLISLEYRALTRKLIVEVIKTRGLGMLSGSKPQDVSVELKLIGGNKQVLRICRTSVKKHVIDTEFNEMFMFRLNIERLKEVTLQISVIRFSEVRNKKEKIGECSFGVGSSGNEQQEHWDNMLKSESKAEYKWHPLYK